MKVYIIQKGQYSDRHIVGVVTDEDRAKHIVNAVSGKYGFEKADYETYDTDQFDERRLRFIVNIIDDKFVVEFDDYDFYNKYNENTRISNCTYVIYAEDKEHAIKIAQDMEAEYQAEVEGIKI